VNLRPRTWHRTPTALKLQITSRTRSALVNAAPTIAHPAPALIIVDLTHPQAFSLDQVGLL
jgi:hypothetical protein